METTRISLALLLAFAASVYCIPAHGAVGDPCAKNPCSEGGTCIPVGPGEHFHFDCHDGKCGTENFDFRCEYPDPCNEHHCQNGGTCYSLKSGDLDVPQPECACARGYYGAKCEFYNGFCDSNPCKYGGTCWVAASNSYCTCRWGTFGRYCEINHCDPQPCQNGGSCLSFRLSGFYCNCRDGYYGQTCERKG